MWTCKDQEHVLYGTLAKMFQKFQDLVLKKNAEDKIVTSTNKSGEGRSQLDMIVRKILLLLIVKEVLSARLYRRLKETGRI